MPTTGDLVVAAIAVVIWLGFWAFDKVDPWSSRVLAGWATWYGTLAVIGVLGGVWLGITLVDGGFAAWCAFWAWKRRKPRQRKPSKALGLVRDLGHRLVVSNA